MNARKQFDEMNEVVNMMMEPRIVPIPNYKSKQSVLFICKKNECYGFNTYTRRSSGLYNSTRFIVEALEKFRIQAKIVEVIDNNYIDREVTQYRPDIVVIEALWVVPEKFPILMRLHPNVKWYVHMHSHMPFLAHEGIAMEWIKAYADIDVGIIANSRESYEAFLSFLEDDEVVFLPNVYINKRRKFRFRQSDVLDIGCFGAIRPLKNQLLQALAAIEFAKQKGKYLRFHVNGSRQETGGDQVIKNLRALFNDDRVYGQLVESKWNEPEEFIDLLQTMDIGLQVSLTETFNVVCADYVTAGIPVVASKEVKWLSRFCWAKDDSIESIVRRMHLVFRNGVIVWWNQLLLKFNSARAQAKWVNFALGKR